MFAFLRDKGGFSLLEVVFATAILGIGLLAYTTLKASSKYSRVYAEEVSKVVDVSATQLSDLSIQGGYDLSYIPPSTVVVSGVPLNVSWQVKDKCPSELSRLYLYSGNWYAHSITLSQVKVRP